MEQLAALIAATLSAGTPLLLAGIGLLINERSGVLNLGAEGMMLIAAAAGFAVGFHSGSDRGLDRWRGGGHAVLADLLGPCDWSGHQSKIGRASCRERVSLVV